MISFFLSFFINSFIHSFVHSFFLHSFVHPFVRSFVRSSVHSFIRPSVYSRFLLGFFSNLLPYLYLSISLSLSLSLTSPLFISLRASRASFPFRRFFFFGSFCGGHVSARNLASSTSRRGPA
ncbi:hypothetical protein C8R47DRAFT_1137738 [Mycena vitilis]|nr:hypothetical protein C8R47DRAFT_1137738 [Mycena vitilis]